MKFYVLKYTANPKGYSGERCNSSYDVSNSCSNCRSGVKLIGNLITKGITNVRTSFFVTLSGDFLISQELYDFMSGKGLRIKELRIVVDYKKKELPYYHLYTEQVFPKFLQNSEGLIIENQCPICHRNGYFSDVKIGDNKKNIPTVITPLVLRYTEIPLNFLESSEFFSTWEYLGLSNLKVEGIKIVRYARPMMIVSERIKLAFEEFGVKNAKFEEVIIQ